jgi:hypothetical protein
MAYLLDNQRQNYETQIELHQHRLQALDTLKTDHTETVSLDTELVRYLSPDHPPHEEVLLGFFEDKDETTEREKLSGMFSNVVSAYRQIIGSIPSPGEYKELGDGFEEDDSKYRALREVVDERVSNLKSLAELLKINVE